MYQRYRVEKKHAPPICRHPHRFKVKINRFALFIHLLREIFFYKRSKVVKSVPCVYGVFSGPIGGFAARERLCVGCLRCTTQYPHISTILHNPLRERGATPYIDATAIDTIMYEAENGTLSVKGAGFRGKFGGKGFDKLWTDMSEIVRPTRDGIYGREHISTEVSLGERPPFLCFDEDCQLTGALPSTLNLPFPMLFDTLDNAEIDHPQLAPILAQTALDLKTTTFLPFSLIKKYAIRNDHVAPSIKGSELEELIEWKIPFKLVELTDWDPVLFAKLKNHFPKAQIILRCSFESNLISYYKEGCRLFHLSTEEGWTSRKGRDVVSLIQQAHLSFVDHKVRDHVTLIGSGAIISAEHIPKALLLGLDAVALRSCLLVALQVPLSGKNAFHLPAKCTKEWAVQRLKNLMGAWQDQLFEAAGAMGIREIRRMRGERGRILFQQQLEQEAFGNIKGYQ